MRLKLQEFVKYFENNVKIRDAGGQNMDFAFLRLGIRYLDNKFEFKIIVNSP